MPISIDAAALMFTTTLSDVRPEAAAYRQGDVVVPVVSCQKTEAEMAERVLDCTLLYAWAVRIEKTADNPAFMVIISVAELRL